MTETNKRVFEYLSDYLNLMPDVITEEMIKETKDLCGVSSEEAFRILFMGIMDIYEDKELRNGWFSNIFQRLDPYKYENNPYVKTIEPNFSKCGDWEFTKGVYKPYEAFVYNDPIEKDGKIIPRIGFFEKEYTFPVVMQGGREWMLITPNEIETMALPIEKAHGDVTTYGLGLGYFAFMVSEKDNVESVTVIENDKSIIKLFEENILPFFPNKEKIRIICEDAFEYAEKKLFSDFVFADIWHDPSDGCSSYLRLKALERPDTEYSYWIENTIKYYL